MNKEQQIEEIAKKMQKCYEKNGLLNFKWFAEALYNAGYRKTFTSDLASDTQKAYKDGYKKGVSDMQSECGICNRLNLKRAKTAVVEFADFLKEYARSCKESGYDGIGEKDIDEKLKEYEE